MAKSKLIPLIALGAVAGAVISLMDKETRTQTVQSVKNAKEKVTYYAQNRDELEHLIASKTEQIQSLYTNNQETINSFLSGGKDGDSLPKTLLSMVTDTKDAFSKNNF